MARHPNNEIKETRSRTTQKGNPWPLSHGSGQRQFFHHEEFTYPRYTCARGKLTSERFRKARRSSRHVKMQVTANGVSRIAREGGLQAPGHEFHFRVVELWIIFLRRMTRVPSFSYPSGDAVTWPRIGYDRRLPPLRGLLMLRESQSLHKNTAHSLNTPNTPLLQLKDPYTQTAASKKPRTPSGLIPMS